jgi:hypothetical protein
MDSARADILAARHRLHHAGLDPAQRRRLSPPAAAGGRGLAGRAAPAIGLRCAPAGRRRLDLHPIGHGPQGRVDARWLDAADARSAPSCSPGLTMRTGVTMTRRWRCRAVRLGAPRAVPARPAAAHRRRVDVPKRGRVRHRLAAACATSRAAPSRRRCW